MPNAAIDPTVVFFEADLHVNMTVTYTGRLFCNGTNFLGIAVTSVLRVPEVVLKLYAPSTQLIDDAGAYVDSEQPLLTQERADSILAAMSLDSTGLLTLNKSKLDYRTRWWAEMDPLNVAPQPISWLLNNPSSACDELSVSETETVDANGTTTTDASGALELSADNVIGSGTLGASGTATSMSNAASMPTMA